MIFLNIIYKYLLKNEYSIKFYYKWIIAVRLFFRNSISSCTTSWTSCNWIKRPYRKWVPKPRSTIPQSRQLITLRGIALSFENRQTKQVTAWLTKNFASPTKVWHGQQKRNILFNSLLHCPRCGGSIFFLPSISLNPRIIYGTGLELRPKNKRVKTRHCVIDSGEFHSRCVRTGDTGNLYRDTNVKARLQTQTGWTKQNETLIW